MTVERTKALDETGWRLLEALQDNARLSYAELGQRVGLSSSSVIERVHRLEEAGIITGYHAVVNLRAVGLPVLALIQLKSFMGQNCRQVIAKAIGLPEVLASYQVTGTNCVMLKVAAISMEHLEHIIEQLALYGPAETSLVLSKPMERRTLTRELLERAEGEEESL